MMRYTLRSARLLVAFALALPLIVVGVPDRVPQADARMRTSEISWTQHGQLFESQEIKAPITMVGLTWDDEAPEMAWYRVKKDGRWTGWIPLEIQDDHAPDLDTDEGRNTVEGSGVVWTGLSDAVQFRTTGEGSADAVGALIDTTDRSQPGLQRLGNLLTPKTSAAGGEPAQPFIHPRSEWDPSNKCAPRRQSDFGQITHAFVHHTSSSEAGNRYSRSQVPARILGTCLFHRDSRGWNDLGYNFLIDKYGRIWEGRAGGIDKGVQGGHTLGFNSYSIGIAFIGYHKNSGPSQAAQNALVELLAWKFGVHNVDAQAVTTVVSKGSQKWPKGVPVRLRSISGHKDGQVTSCPGASCYRKLPNIRARVDARWTDIPLSLYKSPLVGDFDGDAVDEAAVFRTTDGHWLVTEPNGTTNTWADFTTANGWSRQIVGDFTGDGKDDIANFHPSNGTWWVSRSTGSGFSTSLWADFSTPSGWTIQTVGDFDGDGRDDIANRHVGNGTWWVVRSAESRFRAAANWGTTATYDHISRVWVQDIDADGSEDLLAFDAYNGYIYRHMSSNTSFDIDWIIDTPWRTTLGGAGNQLPGTTSWMFFGQEFQWVRVSEMDVVIPANPGPNDVRPEAVADVLVTLPRP